MVIGLTGAMGAGKSVLADLLRDLGAIVLNADKIGHRVIEEPLVRQSLVRAFGQSIIGSDGQLDRRQLGHLAFADNEKLQMLNALVRPALEQDLWRQVALDREQNRGRHLIIDAPLIFEWDIENRFDVIIVVHTDVALRMERLAIRGVTANEIKGRLAGQFSAEEKKRRADIVVYNNGNMAALALTAQTLWKRFKQPIAPQGARC